MLTTAVTQQLCESVDCCLDLIASALWDFLHLLRAFTFLAAHFSSDLRSLTHTLAHTHPSVLCLTIVLFSCEPKRKPWRDASTVTNAVYLARPQITQPPPPPAVTNMCECSSGIRALVPDPAQARLRLNDGQMQPRSMLATEAEFGVRENHEKKSL